MRLKQVIGLMLQDEIEMATVRNHPTDTPSHRVMAYCHDSVGIGHLRRTMSICHRLSHDHPDSSSLLATGTPYVPLFDQIPRVDYVKLPALMKVQSGTYGSKFLNISLGRLLRCRESMLLRTAEHLDPDVLLVDKAPLGVCRELLPTLQWLRRHRPRTRIIFGMRDIEDAPEATIRQWKRDGVLPVLDECFDEIWVYGMAEVFNPLVEYRIPSEVGKKVRFMGYVTRGGGSRRSQTEEGFSVQRESSRNGRRQRPSGKRCSVERGTQRNVLVTVGGGTDGEALLSTYLAEAAGRVSAMGVTSTVVGGPDLPATAAKRLRHQAGRINGVQWVDFEPSMARCIARARLVVSMGGYNTLCEIASQQKPVLVVPRIRPRLEQAIRTHRWSKLGGAFLLPPSELTASTLAARVIDLLEHGPKSLHPDLDLNGLDRVAERFDAFWRKDACHATSVCV